MSLSTRGFKFFVSGLGGYKCMQKNHCRKSNISNINCSYLTFICFSKHTSHERDRYDGKLPWVYACNNLICIPWVMKELLSTFIMSQRCFYLTCFQFWMKRFNFCQHSLWPAKKNLHPCSENEDQQTSQWNQQILWNGSHINIFFWPASGWPTEWKTGNCRRKSNATFGIWREFAKSGTEKNGGSQIPAK
jgi:hypothetical protein